MPKVSVVIPIFNVEKYIERCARSLFEQTLDDIEYIFIDDCSPDQSIKLLESILAEYPDRISQTKIIRLAQNIGAANVRKEGIMLATGEYIIQCDSDDWVERDMYELMYSKAISDNLDMVICDIYNKSNKYNTQSALHKDKKSLIFELLAGNRECVLWNKLVKRTVFNNNIIFPTAHLAEDYALTPQMVYYSNSIGYIDKALYHYCLNSGSITEDISNEKVLQKVSQHAENVQLIFDFFQREAFILPDYVAAVMKWRCRFWLTPIIGTDEGYKLWKNMYPELNRTFLRYKEIPFRKKINFVLSYCRMTGVIKFIKVVKSKLTK